MNQTLKLTTAASIAAISTALAGPTPAEVAPHAPSTTGDWCNSLQTFGKFHSDKNASFIQELKFFGRFQWQAGSVDATISLV